MKMYSYSKGVGLSLVTVLLLASNAYAGLIIGANASDPYVSTTPPTQYGFGGWNFDNVNVKIVDVRPDFSDNGGYFNTSTGVYDPMILGESFESEIISREDNMSVMGHLHGKDWPVGEPAGIKIINRDMNVATGKPENCIMTTAYMEGGYLNTPTPKPVICSSPFQTHKRFKVNMLPSSIEGVALGTYGKPIDMVFNLEANDNSIQKYQVLQKINNYTGKRLDGYKIEVLDGHGAKNVNLTLSLDSSIWAIEDLSNFSHGLWGPVDDNFPVQGFFDDLRSYYPVALSADHQTISYVGALKGGNYQAIFGNWLYSEIAPEGIFFDDDGNPETDAALIAYWGNPLGTGEGWHKGEAENWEKVSDGQVDAWLADESGAYKQNVIEDVLNLGLNYIVSIGANGSIGKTFMLRITPHVSADQTTPDGIAPEDIDPPIDADDIANLLALDTEGNSASSGGGCTYNPNSKNFDMTFLFMIGLGLLYPFRRRFLK